MLPSAIRASAHGRPSRQCGLHHYHICTYVVFADEVATTSAVAAVNGLVASAVALFQRAAVWVGHLLLAGVALAGSVAIAFRLTLVRRDTAHEQRSSLQSAVGCCGHLGLALA